MNLIPGEAILSGSVEAGLVITTHRVRVDAKGWGQAHVYSIMLDELCSTELRYTSQPLLFLLAFLLLSLGGIITLLIGSQASNLGTLLRFLPMCGGVLFAIGAALLYFVTRRMSLVFASAGSSIAVDAMSIGVDRAKELMDTIESAKNYRYFQSNMLPPEYQPVDYPYNM
jgi:hypothetical protein